MWNMSMRRSWRGSNVRALFVLFACLVTSLGLWIWPWQSEQVHSPVQPAAQSVEPATAARDDLTDAPRYEVGRSVANTASEPSESARPAGAASIGPADNTSDNTTIARESTSPSVRVVTGTVVHDDGGPATAATVRLGSYATGTDDDGRFELPVGGWMERTAALVATEGGHTSAVVPNFGALVQRGEPLPPEQRLVLGDTPLAIAGHIRFSDDTPASNWCVGLLDGTETASGFPLPVTAESLAAGATTAHTTTNVDGMFKVGGLYPRRYKLRCWSNESLMSFLSEPIEAGTSDVALRVPSGLLWPRLDGRVVASDGSGVGNVFVMVALMTWRSGESSSSMRNSWVRTDARGEFVLENVPHHWVYLDIYGDTAISTRVDLDDIDPTRVLEILVIRRCQFKFESAAEAKKRPDMLTMLDEMGEPELVYQIQNASWVEMSHAPLIDGKSGILSASEGSKVLVLMHEQQQIARFPITLVPGEVLGIRK